MIQERLCGGLMILDRFERRELMLLMMALCIAQEQVVDRRLRGELIELEHKIFGDNESFMDELDNLIKT